MKKYIIVLVACIFMSSFMLSSCGNDESMDEYFWKNVSEYSTTKNEDGSVDVTLTAPAYADIILSIAQDTGTSDISVKQLKEIIKNKDYSEKQYAFSATSENEADIQVAFNDQVAYDLVINAISETEPPDFSSGE